MRKDSDQFTQEALWSVERASIEQGEQPQEGNTNVPCFTVCMGLLKTTFDYITNDGTFSIIKNIIKKVIK